MQFEAVGRVAVRDLGFKVRGQVNDVDGAERTFLDAYPAAYAETLGNICNLRFRRDFDAELACAYHGTGLLAFLPTFLIRTTFRYVYYRQRGVLFTFGLHCTHVKNLFDQLHRAQRVPAPTAG